jgi:glycine betaine/proline transport system substrate-binding protein
VLKLVGLERFQHGSGETLQTSIAAAYADKAPWFGYYWAPTAVLGKYPMVRVEVPSL